MGRGFFGVLAGIGILIALGLILTHATEVSTIGGAAKNDILGPAESIIRDLQLQTQHGTNK